jgi:hypothetical protein
MSDLISQSVHWGTYTMAGEAGPHVAVQTDLYRKMNEGRYSIDGNRVSFDGFFLVTYGRNYVTQYQGINADTGLFKPPLSLTPHMNFVLRVDIADVHFLTPFEISDQPLNLSQCDWSSDDTGLFYRDEDGWEKVFPLSSAQQLIAVQQELQQARVQLQQVQQQLIAAVEDPMAAAQAMLSLSSSP